jgi:serine/threonine protein phosphatase 1
MTDLTFAVADLHGRLDLLDAALTTIERRASGGTIVFLGDYVDRGPDGAGVLDRLMAGPPPGWRWICLKGNHEAIMALALRNPERLDWWIENGGDTTVASYRDRRELIARHLPWIEALPAIHIDIHRVFVHAGVDPLIPLDRQPDKTLLWKRYPQGADGGHGDRHVVHGHDPDVGGPRRFSGRTDLDTLAWKTGRLVVGLFDDATAGGPIDLIEIKGAGI